MKVAGFDDLDEVVRVGFSYGRYFLHGLERDEGVGERKGKPAAWVGFWKMLFSDFTVCAIFVHFSTHYLKPKLKIPKPISHFPLPAQAQTGPVPLATAAGRVSDRDLGVYCVGGGGFGLGLGVFVVPVGIGASVLFTMDSDSSS